MTWILGLVAMLVVGVLLANLLLSKGPPQRKTRPPLVWRKDPRFARRRHAGAVAPSSAPSSDTDALFAATSDWESIPSGNDPSSGCDTGSASSGDFGDCGSGGGGID